MINILGLALGLACSLLILLWIQNELDIDAFHINNKQLYTVYKRSYYDHKLHGSYDTPGVLDEELKKQIPEIQYATEFSYFNFHTFQVGDKILKLNGTNAGADYFKMFSFQLIEGTPGSALNTPASIAISKKMAIDFYGSPQQAIGKTIKYENKKNFTITAVFDDLPKNASQKFEYLINWSAFLEDNSWAKSWGNNGPTTYLMLRKDANAARVEQKLTHFLDNLNTEQKKGVFTIELGMQPFSKVYLHSNFTDDKIDGGRIENVHLFSIVAVFILLIACINFMNLTTAQSVKRAREIGVRKVIGAVRSVLIQQFIGESLLLTSVAVIFSLVLLFLLLPVFNTITGKQIDLPFNQLMFWLRLIAIAAITGIISGIYPALFLSSFKPVKVLKGAIKLAPGATLFRKGLVIIQFVLSVGLIISTIIISRQVNFIQNQNLGFDRENLVYIQFQGELHNKYGVFKTEAMRMPGIQQVTHISDTPTDIENGTGGVSWEGKDPNLDIEFTYATVGYDLAKTLKLKFTQGRDFSKDFATDTAGYLVNETALKRIGYTNPIGKPLTFWGKKGTIIGVLKDFHFASLHDPITPLVIRLGEQETYGNILVRTQAGKTKDAIKSLETISKQLNPNFNFNYNFSDDEYQKLYDNEQVISKLSNIFAVLAILISCLGLLGLAIFTAEQRVKEIGIRKVLGASFSSLFGLLSSEFLILVIIALLIASPLAWFAMNKWLRNYAYHTTIDWWIFVLAGLAAIVITLLTISFQTIKAALINPVKSLRSE